MQRKRRVPKCKINWACVYRSDLCRSKCSSQRTPRDDSIVIDGDDCYVKRGGCYIHYIIPKKTKQLMLRFDRGDDEDDLVGTYTLLPPSSSKR
jgi:hypothetical protein